MVLFVLAACHRKNQEPIRKEAPQANSTAETDLVTLPIEVRAKKITLQDGLPSNTVNSMLQDQKGFLWFGTHNGLVRYDGNKMTVYCHDGLPTSIVDSRVKNIVEDRQYKKLWVYTSAELFSCIDMHTGNADNYLGNAERAGHYTSSKLTAPGTIWLWGKSDGALRVDYRDGHFRVEQFDKHNLGSSAIIHFDSISSHEVLLCTKDKAFVHDAHGLSCVSDGIGYQRTLPWKGRVLMVTDKGAVYDLYRRKLTFITRISLDKGERISGDMMQGNRWMIFTDHATWAVGVQPAVAAVNGTFPAARSTPTTRTAGGYTTRPAPCAW